MHITKTASGACAIPVVTKSPPRVRNLAACITAQYKLGYGAHRCPIVHRRPLDPAERLRLAHGMLRHEKSLGPFDELASLQALAQIGYFALKCPDFGESRGCHLDGRQQITLLEWLDEVGHGPGVPGPLDQVPLAECRKDDHRRDALVGDLRRSRDSIHFLHLDVADDEVRVQVDRQGDSLLTVGRLADDVVALLLQHLPQVEANKGLVFGDEYSRPAVALGGPAWASTSTR